MQQPLTHHQFCREQCFQLYIQVVFDQRAESESGLENDNYFYLNTMRLLTVMVENEELNQTLIILTCGTFR